MMAENPTRVLLIDDDEDDHFIFRDLLLAIPREKFDLTWRSSFSTGRDALFSESYDVCFLDYRLGPQTGLDLLRDAVANHVKTPMILLTGYGEHEVDIEAMRLGAADYLIKDQINMPLLERTIRYAIHRAQSAQALLEREAQILVQDRLATAGLLASSLAHEIGTPLGVIRGRAEFLEMQFRDNPAVKKNLDAIVSQIDRVSKLIRSLLNLARGDDLKVIGKIDLNETVSEVLELMTHEMAKNHIQVINELPGPIDIAVKAEAGPLHQVLLNLLVNSVHAIQSVVSQGRREGHFIRISLNDFNDKWQLNVEDSGSGISETNLKHLFKPFFTTKDIGVGTGLGLATSYRIVESWGGSIQVRSQEGKGAEFQVLLPKSSKG